MTGRLSRPRPRSLWSGAFFVPVLLLAGVVSAGGQQPDTLPDPAPPERLPDLPPTGPAGWAAGVWEWSRHELLQFPDLTLVHLLQRIPGVVPVRSPVAGQPEATAIFGATTGAVRYVVDGFELDPLTTPTFDPSRLPLLALESVRVERRVTGATVRIETAVPTDPRAHSVIEAGTGDLGINLFRGTVLAPAALGGPLALGFERLASGGFAGASVNHIAGWLKWTWVREAGGVQVEYRQSELDRAGVGQALSGARTDWAVRARRALGPVTAEAYAGASAVEDVVEEIVLREGTPQGGLRLHSVLPAPVPAEVSVALRLRGHPRLPVRELEVTGWVEPMPWLGFGMEGVHGVWRDGAPTGRWAARGVAGPFLGVTAFAGLFGGESLLGDGAADLRLAPADAGSPLELSRRGARAGLELRHGGLALGAAAVRAASDSVPGFGLAFDPTVPRFGGGEASGIEAHVRIPTGWDPLHLEGWYVGMDATPEWLYLPDDHWRTALVYHHLPLPSGNLEIRARAEYLFRGSMATPDTDLLLGRVGAIRSTNLELTIRVVTVRAFLRWENIFHRRNQHDLPGWMLPGQTAVYGVKWEFWN